MPGPGRGVHVQNRLLATRAGRALRGPSLGVEMSNDMLRQHTSEGNVDVYYISAEDLATTRPPWQDRERARLLCFLILPVNLRVE